MGRRTWVVVGVVAALVALVTFFVARRGVRAWWWDGVVSRPLTDDEVARLDACDEVPFGVAAKALVADRATPCGEPWFARELGRHARGPDQAAWLAELLASPAAAEGARMRVALALAVADRTTSADAAWIRLRLDVGRRADFRAVGVDPELAHHLGPGGVALGLADRVAMGDLTLEEAAPALSWLAALGEDEADVAVMRAVTAETGVDDAVIATLRDRRAHGRPPSHREVAGRDDLAIASCEGDGCAPAALRAALEGLRATTTARGEPAGDPVPASPELDASLQALGWSDEDRAAMQWQVVALRIWVADDADRLRRAWTRDGEGSTLRLGWDGAGTPFTAALVFAAVDPSLTFRSDRAGTVWASVSPWSARGCVVPVEQPEEDWPLRAVAARAALEAGDAFLAARWDPLVPAPRPTGDPVAVAIGASFAAAIPDDPGPARADRERVTEGFCAR